MPHREGVTSIAVVCEADADRRIVCDLVDRVLVENVDWIEPVVLDAYREWRGYSRDDAYLKVHHVFLLARQRGMRVQGRFGGEPGGPMSHMARTALVLLATCDSPPDAVIVVVDSDDDHQARRAGLEQARNDRPWPFRTIVIGLAHTKRECWVLAGYAPAGAAEAERLRAVREELGFDPTTRPELLTAQNESAKTSAKRVLRELTGGDVTREPACWQDPDLQTLRGNGRSTGLSDFLEEVEVRLVPLFK